MTDTHQLRKRPVCQAHCPTWIYNKRTSDPGQSLATGPKVYHEHYRTDGTNYLLSQLLVKNQVAT